MTRNIPTLGDSHNLVACRHAGEVLGRQVIAPMPVALIPRREIEGVFRTIAAQGPLLLGTG